jgi:hypothetical protein
MPILKQPTTEESQAPDLVIGYRRISYSKPQHWKMVGYYCPHCSIRRLKASLIREHAKTCKHTKIQLKAREKLVRALKGRSVAYVTYI